MIAGSSLSGEYAIKSFPDDRPLLSSIFLNSGFVVPGYVLDSNTTICPSLDILKLFYQSDKQARDQVFKLR